MTSEREKLAAIMASVHLITLKLARYFVEGMDDAEVERRFKVYAGVELSAAGSKSKSAGDESSTRFSRPATVTAG